MRDQSGVVKVVGPGKAVLSLLKISRLDRVLGIYATLDEALKG
jgi:hypothetical protein